MPEIITTSSFVVTTPDGKTLTIKAGKSEVPPEVAEMPMVIAHLVKTPKGRHPMLEGEKGLMIEADEAGQRTTAPMIYDPMMPQLRQEGPMDWSEKSPMAKERAEKQAKEAEESSGSAQKPESGGVGTVPVSALPAAAKATPIAPSK